MADFKKKEGSVSGVGVERAAPAAPVAAPVAASTPGGTPVGTEEMAAPVSRRSRKGVSSISAENEIDRNSNNQAEVAEKTYPLGLTKTQFQRGCIAIGAFLVLIIIIINTRGRTPPSPVIDDSVPQYQVTATNPPTTFTPLTPEEELRIRLREQGIGVFGADDSPHNSNTRVGPDSFVRDLFGQDVPEMWEARAITVVRGYVTFTRHRAVVDEGVELYWLEGDYQGLAVRFNISFSHFRALPDSGVVLCDLEIVETTGGNLIVTHITAVRSEADRPLR